MRFHISSLSVITLAFTVLTNCGGGDKSTGVGPSGPPIVTAVNGATLPTGTVGSTVIIEGSNFGSTQGSSLVLFSNGSGGTVPATVQSAINWADGFIVASVPAGAATGNLVVQTSLGTSTAVVFTIAQNAPFSPSTVAWTATS